MTSKFDWSKYTQKPEQSQSFDWSKYTTNPGKPQERFSLKGTAQALGSGLAGGLGGIPGDIAALAKPFEFLNPSAASITDLAELGGLKGTHELTESFYEPQNASERIAQQAGQFGSQGALFGAGAGPLGALAAGGGGLVAGTIYGALKEAGLDDTESFLGTLALAAIPGIAGKIQAAKRVKLGKPKISAKNVETSTLPKPPNEPPPAPGGIGPGTVLPESKGGFELKEQALGKLAEVPKPPAFGVEVQAPKTKGEAPSLTGRVSEAPQLGKIISKEPFETEASAGREIAHDVKAVRDAEKEIVRDKYKAAEEITATHEDIFSDLAKKNEERIDRLEQLTKRSTGEEAVYQDALALRKIIGTPDGLIETNASRLMKQANSFSQKINYEQAYAGYKGEIKSIVHEMNEAVIQSLKAAKKNPEAVIEADRNFSRFADRFMNDEIAPFFNRKIQNPEELAKKAISDPATYRSVKKAIGSRKSDLINKIDREIVHQKMDKYYKNPALVDSKEYTKDLKSLSELIGKEKIGEVDIFLREKAIANERKLFQENKLKEAQLSRSKIPSKGSPECLEGKVAPKLPAKTPEELDRLFSSRSGIRRLRKEYADRGLEKEFNKLADNHVEEIFKEGGFGERKITGKDMARIIDREHDVLVELWGQENVSDAYKLARKAADKELTEEIIKDFLKGLGKVGLQTAGLGKLIKLLPLKRI